MNKFCRCIALALVCMTGPTFAQKSWTISEESAKTIEVGTDHFYVLQEGDETNAQTGNKGSHSKGYFLSSAAPIMSPEVKNSCIFNFFEDGVNKAGHKMYVLKNVENQLYLGPNATWVKTTAQAYRFSLAKAKPVEEGTGGDAQGASWEEFYNIVSAGRSSLAEGLGAWVLCHPERKEYIGFIGEGLSFRHYIDTNNWLIKKAEGTEMSAQDKFLGVFSKYFDNISIDNETFPVGDAPGCVSEDFYKRLESTYEEAAALTSELSSASEEDCNEMIQRIIDIFNEYETKAMVKVSNGFFIVRNERGDLKDNGKNGVADKNLKLEELTSWNLSNARYIWQVEENEEGKLFFKNFGTGKYLGKNNNFAMTNDPTNAFTTPHFKGILFNLHDGNRLVNVMTNGGLTNWDPKNDPGNLFRFEKVAAIVIDTLGPVLEKNQMNKKLKELVNAAKRDLMSVKYTNGFMASGDYNHPSDTGLVRKFMAANASSTAEGREADAFDGNLDSYYHTAYGNDAAANDVVGSHWVQFNLGKKVTNLVVKFTERKGNYNGSPVQFKLTGAENDEPTGEWNIELAKSADSILYTFPSEFKDSATYIQKFELKEPSQYVRFEVIRTKKSIKHNNGSGPLWHVSEFRLYDADDIKDNPKFKVMDQEAVKNLQDAIATAEGELKEKAASEKTYEALEEAIDNFWENYPNSSDLENTLEIAEEMAKYAVQGNEIAQYKDGSVDIFKSVVGEIKKIIEGKTLSLAEIKKYQKELDEAIDTFNKSLIVPETNKIYRLVCTAPLELPEGNPHTQWGSSVTAMNADLDGNPTWRYESADANNSLNAFWEVKQDEQGFTFRNIATGRYLGNPYEGLDEEAQKEVKGSLIKYSDTPKHFTLEAAHLTEKAFLIRFKKGQYLNADPNRNIVHYFDRNDPHAFFTFKEVTEEFDGIYQIDVAAEQIQILSLPIQLDALYTLGENESGNSNALKVSGKRNGKIQLNYYEDGEIIPAGTPFVIVTRENETTIDGEVTSSLSELKNLKYNYKEVNQKGLISTPKAFNVKVPYGILLNGKVIAAEIGTHIPAGSGYFNTDVPEVTEDGEFSIVIEGEITGEGTSVENIKVVKNTANDVYTISGVKLRNNVKGSAATEGLPKGIYIIGGKKVIVK